ncbi:MAG: serine hydrolase [Microcoleaceae cyanobacterium]|jgi:beta-lactamase class A
MQLKKVPPHIKTRRPLKRYPVNSRRYHATKLHPHHQSDRAKLLATLAGLKYGNILFLLAGAIVLSWLITSPFRNKPTHEPPIIAQLSSITLPIESQNPRDVSSRKKGEEFIYNVKVSPHQVPNPELQKLVDELVEIVRKKGLPTSSLSISLIDVSNPKSHYFSGYQNRTFRFPASVAKLFWMVAFYGAVQNGIVENESDFYSDLEQMMQVSHNDSASRILDKITDTKSGEKLGGIELNKWIDKRLKINTFFQKSGYDGIQLAIKNYPIYYLNQQEPIGRDLQLRELKPESYRNLVTTDQAARLLYEIYTRQAISPTMSRKMAYLLTRDLDPKVWKNDPSNGIKGFLGESLPTNIYFASKVGYTSTSRQEVAFVRTLDDRVIYIFAIFADAPAYAKDEEIFPQLSRYVFDHFNAR